MCVHVAGCFFHYFQQQANSEVWRKDDDDCLSPELIMFPVFPVFVLVCLGLTCASEVTRLSLVSCFVDSC